MERPEDDPVLRVLLLDPLAGSQVVALGMLRGLGHTAFGAYDLAMAEILLDREKPDAVVMAFDAPMLDAAAALDRLRRRRAPRNPLPAVGMTHGARLNEDRMAADAGFDALLRRPFDPVALDRGLRQAVRDRTPAPALDPAVRAALRERLGPAALAAADEAAIDVARRLVGPLFEDGGSRAAFVEAGTTIAAAMAGIGALVAAEAARLMAEEPRHAVRALRPLMTALVDVRVALRADRMTAARPDPISAASETPPGDTP